jgi:site-specific DNA-methyltransferase (adenine-specific)
MIEMLNCDCMDYMATLPDKAFDLAIVDPPYGIGMDGGKRQYSEYERKNWDTAIPDKKYFSELFRVSEHQIIWGGNYFGLPPFKCFLIWDKTLHGNTYADGEMAWTSFNKVARIFPLNICFNRDRIHPTQKPVALYKWILKNYAKPGDKILDTHGGSGSICIACHDLGYDLTWMELDPDYYEAAVKRYKNHAAQASLFDPVELTKSAEQPTPDLFQ